MTHTTLLVITDGRLACLGMTLRSFQTMAPPVDAYVMVNDSTDADYAAHLEDTYGRLFTILHPGAVKRGFAGAIEAGWAHIRSKWRSGTDVVFHLEDDFTFNRLVPLDRMIGLLWRRPELAQVALRRQAVSPAEITAGGVVEQYPDAYRDRSEDGDHWLEHRLFFTTNPSVYRASLCELGWPVMPRSEGNFTHRLLADPDMRFAYWGRRYDDPWVHHIGDVRVGSGY